MKTLFSLLCLFLTFIPAWADDPIQIGITAKTLDAFFDLPFGVHQVKGTNVIFSKKMEKVDLEKDDEVVGLDVTAITRSVLVDKFTKEKNSRFTISPDASGDSLQITPWLFMQVLDDGRVFPWVVWNVDYVDLYWGKRKWQGQCFCGLTAPKPLEGKDSWTSDGGLALKMAVKMDTDKLLDLTKNELGGVYKKASFQSGELKSVWIGETKSKKIHVNYIEAGPEALLIKTYDNQAAMIFLAAGATGLLLKSLFPNSVLFNGSLVLSKDNLEPFTDIPTPAATLMPSK